MPAAPPRILPLFPLTGSLLLPGNWLPLNVFETRYRNLVADSLAEGRHIGMIQPLLPQQDNRPPLLLLPEDASDGPELYSVGCAGRIEQCDLQPDGRYLVLLKGVSRFRLDAELPLHRGYRRAAAEYAEFAGDFLEPELPLDASRAMSALQTFGKAHGLSFDFDLLASLPGVSLVNGLAVALPFGPAEKQALLEADRPECRLELLLALMGMGLDAEPQADYYAPPILH
ncbi:MAG TPA: LON peptidase substrate-binding domain-containing protein [Thermoanaerobaculia bacterium]